MQTFNPLERSRSSNITLNVARASPRMPPRCARICNGASWSYSNHGSSSPRNRKTRSNRKGLSSSASSSSTTTISTKDRQEGFLASFSSSSSSSFLPSLLPSARMRKLKTTKISSLNNGVRAISTQARNVNSGFSVRRPRTSRGRPRSCLTALSDSKDSLSCYGYGYADKKTLSPLLLRKRNCRTEHRDVQFLPLCYWGEENGMWRGPWKQHWSAFTPVHGESVITGIAASATSASAIVRNGGGGVVCSPLLSLNSASSEEDEVMSFVDSCQNNGDPSLLSLSCVLARNSASTTQDGLKAEDRREAVVPSCETESQKGTRDLDDEKEEAGEEEDYSIDLSDFKPDVGESDENFGLSSKGGGGLCLTLDFHEVLSAWQNRGCLWAGGQRPPKIAQFAGYSDHAFPYVGNATNYENCNHWRP